MKLSQFLTEARTVAGEAAAKRGLSHAGHGYYADRQGNIVAKSEGGERLVAVDPKEAEQATAVGSQQGADEDAHKLREHWRRTWTYRSHIRTFSIPLQ